MSRPRLRGPFGPIGIPEGPVWDSIFEEIDPIPRASDGKMLRRFRVRGTDIIGVQDLMDQPIYHEQVSVEPMKMPDQSIFYMEFKPPKPYDEMTDTEKAESDARVAAMKASGAFDWLDKALGQEKMT